ncbi:gephyrin-like molybdotransferase Glp [Corallincola spongiicola]|uniref:Molybdopterin molybdenumtransferase n=1 Tax=Corallincola spongiicola TaxID=2520508 RepID=A0ABY1WR47_9GAMM|nr:gephyrin-like molybdotransferase Glp [Corallincola spongiicola]TAA47200.1 molybdopterin molybdenumtransferase MoeA [Corallincola spongiicola]
MGCCDAPGLMPVEQALTEMAANVTNVSETEFCELAQAFDRILAEAVASPLDIPPFDNSAMDGYAFRFADWSADTPMPVVGTALAGQPFAGDIPAGGCVRIMTGALLPAGLDTVVMQENAELTETGDSKYARFAKVKANSNVRYRGEDVSTGDTVMTPSCRLSPRHIGQLACLGIAQVKVYRKLKVAIFSTGDELKQPGEILGKGEIYDSNRIAVKAMLQRLPVDILDLGVVPDDEAKLRSVFQQADSEADVVISSGGVSVGDADYTKLLLEQLGQVGFWKLAIKPGKPFAFGTLPNSRFFGLPGNPVSAVVTCDQLVIPTLQKMMGWQAEPAIQYPAKLTSGLRKRPGRKDYQRGEATLDSDTGQWQVVTTGAQGSAIFSSMVSANGYVPLPAASGNQAEGDEVWFEPFAEWLR